MLGHTCGFPVAVIVDGYSTGRYLRSALAARGVASVHVRSSPTIGSADPQAHSEGYEEVIQYDGDLNRVVESLAKYDVVCVTPGIEGVGVGLADQLARHFGVVGNDPASSERRQNKAVMQAALADAGVAHIPFRQVKSEAELTRACDELGRWPLVVKPLNAGDTQDVLICENLTQAKAALHTIIGKVNRTEQLNEAALVESFIDGDEYVVNTVSLNGEHIITDIWRYDKRVVLGSTRVCLRMKLLPPDGEVQDALASYIGPALQALDLVNGAAHSEVFITSSGPVLGETGARLMGGALDPSIFSEALGYPQIEALADALVDPDLFRDHLGERYDLLRNVEIVNFMMDRSGVIASIPGLDEIRRLPSFRDLIMAVGPGDRVSPTVDGPTCPGHVILSSPDSDQLDRDYETIRATESSVFELA